MKTTYRQDPAKSLKLLQQSQQQKKEKLKIKSTVYPDRPCAHINHWHTYVREAAK